jgi:DNA polymerase-3 subunit beta
MARAGSALVAGSVIDGTFPNYREMVPKPSEQVVRAKAAELVSSLRQAEHLTAEDSRAVTFTIDAGLVRLESRSAAVGEASIELAAEYTGEPLTLAFNARFFLDVIGELEADEVQIEIENAHRPAVIRSDGFVYVIAPVRVREAGQG